MVWLFIGSFIQLLYQPIVGCSSSLWLGGVWATVRIWQKGSTQQCKYGSGLQISYQKQLFPHCITNSSHINLQVLPVMAWVLNRQSNCSWLFPQAKAQEHDVKRMLQACKEKNIVGGVIAITQEKKHWTRLNNLLVILGICFNCFFPVDWPSVRPSHQRDGYCLTKFGESGQVRCWNKSPLWSLREGRIGASVLVLWPG